MLENKTDNILGKVDARVKLPVAIFLIALLSFQNNLPFLGIYIGTILFTILIIGAPKQFLKRLLLCLPFLVFLFFMPFSKAILLFSRALSSILTITLFMMTTNFRDLMRSMRFIGIPKLFVTMFSFLYRYILLFLETLKDMRTARNVRCMKRRQKFDIKTISNMIASLVMRSHSKSEKIYMAMLSRGYNDRD
ncbi:MAG: energy-coupling factor transporter transmembrane component T family protein [Nanobdellota archaeon]